MPECAVHFPVRCDCYERRQRELVAECHELRAALAEQREENEKLRDALAFYADEKNWLDGMAGEWIVERGHPGSYDGFDHDEFESDSGDRARAALSGENTE